MADGQFRGRLEVESGVVDIYRGSRGCGGGDIVHLLWRAAVLTALAVAVDQDEARSFEVIVPSVCGGGIS